MTAPAGYLKFAELVEYIGAAPNTVRRDISEAKVQPLRTGNTLLFTQQQADAVRKHHRDRRRREVIRA